MSGLAFNQERQRWLDEHPAERQALYLLDAKREVRLLDDRELAAFLVRELREQQEHRDGDGAPLWLTEDCAARVAAAQAETERRQQLARRGGPRYDGRPSDVEAIKRGADLVNEIVNRIGPPDRVSPNSYWWRCPLHGEDTPSFEVTPRLGLWHCFGCSAGGDVIRWVELIERVDFSDALRMLSPGQPARAGRKGADW